MLQVSNGIKTHGLTSLGRYTHAIVCRVPSSFATSSLGSTEPINLYEARREHETYVRILRNLGLDVIELPADEMLPDSPFIEDTAIVVNGIALICKPGHPSRMKEVDTVRSVLKRELRLPIVEITNSKACIDGGDVLFTGREFFVGISNRTNEAGAQALADSFPEFTVTPIDLPKKLLHLKSCISMAGPDIICVASSLEAQLVLKRIERDSTYKYYTITVPDECGANVAYINGALMYRSEYPGTNEVFQSKIDYPKVPIKLWELSKPSGNLSGLSLLIEKQRITRH